MAAIGQFDDEAPVKHARGSPIGEAFVSGLVVLVVLIGVVWNLPHSAIKSQLTPILRPLTAAVGLEQEWRMYAPEPIRGVETVEVVVTLADGQKRIWTHPRGDRVIGAFAWYHWQKLKENLVRQPSIRPEVAHWVVREVSDPAEQPVHVEMVARYEALPAPGSNDPRTTSVETLYDETLEAQR